MTSPEQIVDRAMALGERELESLQARDVDQAALLAEERFPIMEEVLGLSAGPDQTNLLDKLVRLKHLQGRLTAEARKLHAALKADLGRTQAETRRMAGYSGSARKLPTNVYVNKRG